MIRLSNLIAALVAMPFAVVLAWLVSASLDRQAPIVYESVSAGSASVPQGGILDVRFTVFRLRICDAIAKRFLTDAQGEVHAIPSYTVGPRPLAGLDEYRRTITIPAAAAVGPAFYQVELAYTCNVLHRLGWPILVKSPPIRFEVTPGPVIILPPLLTEPKGDG